MTGAARTAQALAIRDHLLPLIRVQGVMQELGGSGPPMARMVVWRTGLFAFALRSPVTPGPDAAPLSYDAARTKRRASPLMPWGLDVWHGPKVLSLQWDDVGRAAVISFHRGPWEDEALALGPGPDLDPK